MSTTLYVRKLKIAIIDLFEGFRILFFVFFELLMVGILPTNTLHSSLKIQTKAKDKYLLFGECGAFNLDKSGAERELGLLGR